MFEQFIGVKPVEERHRFDASRLAQYLRGRIEDWRGDLTVEQFKGGQSNPTYRITAGGKRYALRRKPSCFDRLSMRTYGSSHALQPIASP